MKKKLNEGKWLVNRMVREVKSKDNWDAIVPDIVNRSKRDPIIGIVYLVGENFNKALLKQMAEDARSKIKPIHCEILVTPFWRKKK